MAYCTRHACIIMRALPLPISWVFIAEMNYTMYVLRTVRMQNWRLQLAAAIFYQEQIIPGAWHACSYLQNLSVLAMHLASPADNGISAVTCTHTSLANGLLADCVIISSIACVRVYICVRTYKYVCGQDRLLIYYTRITLSHLYLAFCPTCSSIRSTNNRPLECILKTVKF